MRNAEARACHCVHCVLSADSNQSNKCVGVCTANQTVRTDLSSKLGICHVWNNSLSVHVFRHVYPPATNTQTSWLILCKFVCVCVCVFSPTAQQPLVGQGLLIIDASRPHSVDTPHWVGLLWTSDQPRRRDLYLITHNTHKTKTYMAPAGFEPAIPASELCVRTSLKWCHATWCSASFVSRKGPPFTVLQACRPTQIQPAATHVPFTVLQAYRPTQIQPAATHVPFTVLQAYRPTQIQPAVTHVPFTVLQAYRPTQIQPAATHVPFPATSLTLDDSPLCKHYDVQVSYASSASVTSCAVITSVTGLTLPLRYVHAYFEHFDEFGRHSVHFGGAEEGIWTTERQGFDSLQNRQLFVCKAFRPAVGHT
jgi:hypothetical protein